MSPKIDSEGTLGSNLGGKVRSLRRRRGWSLETLAEASGVSRSMLSQVERNETNPTVVVALAVAGALGVSVDELLGVPEGGSPIESIRGRDSTYVYRSDDTCQIRTLSPLAPDRQLEFYEIGLAPGGELRSAPHFAGTREFLTVRQGKVRLECGEHSSDLGSGDSAAYPADVRHAIVNLGTKRAVVYLVDTVPNQ